MKLYQTIARDIKVQQCDFLEFVADVGIAYTREAPPKSSKPAIMRPPGAGMRTERIALTG